MNDRIRGRVTRVPAGIVAAGAAAFIAGGGLLLGGFGSGHQAAPVGVVKGQRADFGSPGASPDDAQCAAVVQELNEGKNFDLDNPELDTAIACDEAQRQDDPDSVSDVCLAVNAHSIRDDQALALTIPCANEKIQAAKASASLDPSSPNLVNQPSASPDDTDPSENPDDQSTANPDD